MALKIFEWLSQPFVLLFYSWAYATVAFVTYLAYTGPLWAALNMAWAIRIKRSGRRDYERLVFYNAALYLHFPFFWFWGMTVVRARQGTAEPGLIVYSAVFLVLVTLAWRRALRHKQKNGTSNKD